MNKMDEVWQRLVRAARRPPAAALPTAPHGFAARVVARWLGQEPGREIDLWVMLARQVLTGAVIVMAGVVAIKYSELATTWSFLTGSGPLLEIMPLL